MGRKRLIKTFLALALCLGFGASINGAILSPGSLPVVSGPGANDLSSRTQLGVPSSFWLVNTIEWQTTEEISIQVDVTGLTTPELNTVLIGAVSNNTPDVWNRFEVELNQPNLFSDTLPAPPSFGTLPTAASATSPQPNTIIFSDFESHPGAFTPPMSFGMFVEGDQPLILTLRPIAVPEPASGLLISTGLLTLIRRRRNSS